MSRPVWLPSVNSRLAILAALPADLFGGVAIDTADPQLLSPAAEGLYVDLVTLPPARQALLMPPGAAAQPVGFVIPLDALFEDRLEAARRLHRLLSRGEAKAADLSVFRRNRLKLALRALDGRQDGAGYRAIAKGLFPRLLGRDREPSEMLIGRAIRLVRYGVRLMNGGYLDLLRPERRAPRSRRR